MNYDKSKASEDKIYIYESPDRGDTIYRREFGKPHNERELIKQSDNKYSTFVIKWTADDVRKIRSDLSLSNACKVIKDISENYDGTQGITWTTIKEIADKIFPIKTS